MTATLVVKFTSTLDDIEDHFDAEELGFIRGLVIQGKHKEMRAVAQIALQSKAGMN